MIINWFGLIFIAVILIPNIIYALFNRGGIENSWHNKTIEIFEQVGRYGCMIFMILFVSVFKFGFSSTEIFLAYLLFNVIITVAYITIWVLFWKRNTVFRALALSILPSLLFLCSGIVSRYLPLVISALIFAPCHIIISYKNAVAEKVK